MKPKLKLLLATLSLMSCGIVSEAQETQAYKRVQEARQAPPRVTRALTSEQQAALDKQDQALGQAALNIVRMIDRDQIGEVWDTGSPLAKRIFTRDAFLARIAADRAAAGAPGMRMPMGARHLRVDGSGDIPAGAYVNLTFQTQFDRINGNAQEMVTFVLDPDNVWRFAGYTLH